MFFSRGTVRYEERGQGYYDVEKVGKHWCRGLMLLLITLRHTTLDRTPLNE